MMNGALLLLMTWFGCGVSSDDTAPQPKEDAASRSLLLITLEDAPATRFTPWGGDDARLQGFADLGTTWTRAYAPTPLRQPNLATLFTGRTPYQHGVWLDGMQRLADEETTLFEALAEAGWSTTSSTGSLLTDDRWGLHQGATAIAVHDELRPQALPADTVVRRLPLAKGAQAAWVHLSADGLDTLQILVERWVDAHPTGWLVVAGVHGRGDGLGLHDDALRMPLMVVGPGFASQATIDDVVSLADVAPTLRAAVGLPPEGPTLLEGGAKVVDHAAHLGRALFQSEVLTGTTETDGRVVRSDANRWYGAVGTSIPDAGHVVPDDHHAVVRHQARQAALPQHMAPAALLPLTERERLARVAPHVLGDPDAPSAGTPPATRHRMPFVVEAAKQLRNGRYREVHRIAGSVEGTPVGSLLDAIAYRNQADADHADAALEAGQATSAGPMFPWHRAEVALDRCRIDDAARWIQVVIDDTAIPPAGLASALHRARAHGPLPPQLQATADALVAAWPDDPQVQLLANPSATAQLPARPGSAVFGLLRARSSWAQGDATEAIEELREAVALDPMDGSLRLALARWYLETDERIPANRLLAPVVRANPEDPVLTELWEASQLTPKERHQRAIDRTWNRP